MVVFYAILFLLSIAGQFYNLSIRYKKNKWFWSTLSIVFFYGILSFINLIIAQVRLSNVVISDDWELLTQIGVTIVCEILFYKVLKRTWQKQLNFTKSNTDLLDDNVQTTHDL